MKQPLLAFDRKLLKSPGGLIGLDEVGRGALAGPVVACAVWAGEAFYKKGLRLKGLELIDDSKVLTLSCREELYDLMQLWYKQGLIKIGYAQGSVTEIESHNIVGATRLAMKRSLDMVFEGLPEEYRVSEISNMPLFNGSGEDKAAKILLDGLPLNLFTYPHEAIKQGDGKSLIIAMASVIAKVVRDGLMTEMGKVFPGYGFEEHKGYGTKDHRSAIMKLGPLPIHRTLFLRKILESSETLNEEWALE